MDIVTSCRAIAPVWLCQHNELLVYLIPSAVLACLIRVLAGVHPLFFLFTLAGTICHELAHLIAGLLLGAKPSSFNIIPRRQGAHWQLGSVAFTRIRWYNAAPVALAPFLILLLPFAVAWWRTTRPGWHFNAWDLAIAFALAPQFLSFWPSLADWKIALKSWPYLFVIAASVWIVFRFVKP
jgi:hypothetical protein